MDSNRAREGADPLVILKDQLHWLKVNGFTEKALHFPGKTGWLEDNISRKYFLAVDAKKPMPCHRNLASPSPAFIMAKTWYTMYSATR